MTLLNVTKLMNVGVEVQPGSKADAPSGGFHLPNFRLFVFEMPVGHAALLICKVWIIITS